MWLYFWAIVCSCVGLALLQEHDCKDTFPQCPNLIKQDTLMACYEQNLGGAGIAISKICCETCNLFKDPSALEGCEYGDKSLNCGPQNCTDPPDEDTQLCCKTCRSNIEAELASFSTTQSTSGMENTPASTPLSLAPSTPISTNAPSQQVTTVPEAATTLQGPIIPNESATVSTIQPTNDNSQNTQPATTNAPSQQETTMTSTPLSLASSTPIITNAPSQQVTTVPEAAMTVQPTNDNSQNTQVVTTNAPSQQEITTMAAVESTKPCHDADRCRNIRPHECYSTYTRERCCVSCNKIAESRAKDCPYGDRLPLWCVLQILRSPRTICRSHDDLCCESCKFVGTNTSRSRVLLLQRKPSIWAKKKLEPKKKVQKGGKSKRKGKGKKSKKGRKKGEKID